MVLGTYANLYAFEETTVSPTLEPITLDVSKKPIIGDSPILINVINLPTTSM